MSNENENEAQWLEVLYAPIKDSYLENTRVWYRLLKVTHLGLAYFSTFIFVIAVIVVAFDGSESLGGMIVGGGIALFVFLIILRLAVNGLIYVIAGNISIDERYRKILEIVDKNKFMLAVQNSVTYSSRLKDSYSKLEALYKRTKSSEDDYYDTEKIMKIGLSTYKEFNLLINERNQFYYLNLLNSGMTSLYEELNELLISGSPSEYIKTQFEKRSRELYDEFNTGLGKMAYAKAISLVQEEELENGTYGRDLDSKKIGKMAREILSEWLGDNKYKRSGKRKNSK